MKHMTFVILLFSLQTVFSNTTFARGIPTLACSLDLITITHPDPSVENPLPSKSIYNFETLRDVTAVTNDKRHGMISYFPIAFLRPVDSSADGCYYILPAFSAEFSNNDSSFVGNLKLKINAQTMNYTISNTSSFSYETVLPNKANNPECNDTFRLSCKIEL